MKFIIRLNPSNDSILAAIIIPIPEIVKEIKNISGTTIRNFVKVILMPIKGENIRIINPCIVLLEAPPTAFPSAMDVLLIGATSISLRNPNSRSHIIDMAENIDENKRVITRIPGNINWIYCKSPTLPKVAPNPVPNSNNQING
jgi:hypothetical protein